MFSHPNLFCAMNNISNSSKKAKFQFMSDGKVLEYSWPSMMAICMMLCFIHATLNSDTEKFNQFKLRGVCTQFREAIQLYALITKTLGKVGENKLHWAVHSVLEALLKPLGLGNWLVDCSIDQMAFLWAFLLNTWYRISKTCQALWQVVNLDFVASKYTLLMFRIKKS